MSNEAKPLTMEQFDKGVTLNADGSAYVRLLDLAAVRATVAERDALRARNAELVAALYDVAGSPGYLATTTKRNVTAALSKAREEGR